MLAIDTFEGIKEAIKKSKNDTKNGVKITPLKARHIAQVEKAIENETIIYTINRSGEYPKATKRYLINKGIVPYGYFLKSPEKKNNDDDWTWSNHISAITENEYLQKTDFRSYFKLIDMPKLLSDRFHEAIEKKDYVTAFTQIKPFLLSNSDTGKKIFAVLLQHCRNAVNRAPLNRV